jgi:PAS domain S-box-containing protein
LLVRREGDTVLFLNDPRHRNGSALAFHLPLTQTNSPAVLAALGRVGTLEGTDYRGEPVLAVSRRVPGTSWHLLTKMDQEEIFAHWRSRTRLVLAVILSGLAITGLVLRALWRRREAGLLREELATHKQMVAQLRKLSSAVEQSPVCIVITDRAGNIEYVNPKFCALTGYTPDEVRGRNPRVLKSGEMPPEGYRQLWETILAGREWRGEFHNKKKNGELYWELASISPIVDETGAITHFLGIKEDITERTRTAAALQKSEENFRAMFELASVGMAQTDVRTGQWLRVNQKLCDITGYSAEELLRLRPDEITLPEDRQRDRELFQRVVCGELPDYRLEKRYVRKDGAVAWVNVNVTVIRDADGQVSRTLAAIEDITERKRAQAEREALVKTLEEALANVKTLSGLVPICANCKKIRDDHGYWSQVETYVAKHSGARFSHGICPECARKLYPEFASDVPPQPRQEAPDAS